jgi:NhaP-type Na+/H+ or K+/H+ antiporter
VPEKFPGRDLILATTLAVILVSILLQGTTLGPLIRLLRLSGFELERVKTLTEPQARLELAEAALASIRHRSQMQDSKERHPRLVEQFGRRAEMARRFVKEADALAPDRIEHFKALLEATQASRAKLLSLHRTGRVHDDVLHALEAELDLEEMSAQRILHDD